MSKYHIEGCGLFCCGPAAFCPAFFIDVGTSAIVFRDGGRDAVDH